MVGLFEAPTTRQFLVRRDWLRSTLSTGFSVTKVGWSSNNDTQTGWICDREEGVPLESWSLAKWYSLVPKWYGFCHAFSWIRSYIEGFLGWSQHVFFSAVSLQEIEATGRNAIEAALAPLGPRLREEANWSGVDEVGLPLIIYSNKELIWWHTEIYLYLVIHETHV